MDVCHVDEAGFALTQPTTTSWGPVGCRLLVPYIAPQGRRLNVIGGYFSHGPQAGDFQFASFASLPKPRKAKEPVAETTRASQAAAQGVALEEVRAIDSAAFLAFVWQLAGRPPDAPPTWKRERPLAVVVDNYGTHKGDRVREELPALQAADVYLFYLPPYSPELSEIEPIWNHVKSHEITRRSCKLLGDLKQEVETALVRKTLALRAARAQSSELLPLNP